MSFLKLTDQNVNGKTVLIRADLNVPFKDGKISDDTRIRASLASIQYCLDNGAGVIVMTHLGRPTEGEFKPEDDVAPVAEHLGKLLGKNVRVLNDWRENKPTIAAIKVKRKTMPTWVKLMLHCAIFSSMMLLVLHTVRKHQPKLWRLSHPFLLRVF